MNLPAPDRIALMLGRALLAGENMADEITRLRQEVEQVKAPPPPAPAPAPQ